MNRLKLKLAFATLASVLPYAAGWVLGCLWLYERELLSWYMAVTAVTTAVAWMLFQGASQRIRASRATPVPIKNWPASGEAAWRDIDELASRAENAAPSITDWIGDWQKAMPKIQPFVQEVPRIVARHFHPRAISPELEVTVPQVLHIAELILRDLQRDLDAHAVQSHVLSLNDLKTLTGGAKTFLGLFPYYRLLAFGFDPIRGIFREVNYRLSQNLTERSLFEVSSWASGFCVRQAGYYAIQLYSGQLALEYPEFASLGIDKPLRVLLLGQTKSGKSSLINALFGQARAKTDVLPCTTTLAEYVIEREGLSKAIVLDTVGFGGVDDKAAREKLDQELATTDLIVVVTSARIAARDPDRKLLDEARRRFSEHTKRAAPPVVVALTHVDTVRPQNEWNPPYDFVAGERPKERNVRDAIEVVAQDLQVLRENVVPVCLANGAVYNVDEGLLAATARVLPESERAKLLRLLMDSRSATDWDRIKRQLMTAGVDLLSLATAVGASYVRKRLADR